METSIFTDKAVVPNDTMLQSATGDLYPAWKQIRNCVFDKYPSAFEEWNSPGQKYGWSFRIKDKKRAIIYLLPRNGYFLVAFVLGAKASEEALNSTVSQEIKDIIKSARVYAEGRGFQIEIKNFEQIEDIKILIDIKLSH